MTDNDTTLTMQPAPALRVATTEGKLWGRWEFIPAPSEQSPANSPYVDSDIKLPVEEVAASFLAFPGFNLTHPAQPDWSFWEARWESADEYIAVILNPLYKYHRLSSNEFPGGWVRSNEFWGGSPITCHCHPSRLDALLCHLNQRHAGIWLRAETGNTGRTEPDPFTPTRPRLSRTRFMALGHG